MKKLCFLLSCVLILQMLGACAGKEEDFQVPTRFYYSNKEIAYNSPAGVIRPETREGAGFEGNVEAFLHAYLLGPVSQDLERIIPSDVYLVSCEADGDTIRVELSTQFSKLSGIDLLTACSAIFLSLHDFCGTETLEISATDSQLDDKDTLTITMDDIVLMDTVNMEE